MKKLICLAAALAMLLLPCARADIDLSWLNGEKLLSLIGVAQQALPQSEEDAVASAAEALRAYWKENNYSGDYYTGDGYLEIVHTRIVYISEAFATKEKDPEDSRSKADGLFADVYCVVDFMLLSDYFGSAPYYMETGMDNCVAVMRNGRLEVRRSNPFNLYRSYTYSADFSGIIESISDLGSEYNAVYRLLAD